MTDVAINPGVYEWASSCIDGHVRIFRYPGIKVAKKAKGGGGGGSYGLVVQGKKVKCPPEHELI